MNGAVYTPGTSALTQFISGGFFHYVDGFVFTILFVVAIHPLLPGGQSAAANMTKAFFFGTLLAIVSLVFMTPRVYAPAMGLHAGFFSHDFGWKFIAAVFIWHWVYAVHLGVLFNPAPAVD